jgi:MFS family permease
VSVSTLISSTKKWLADITVGGPWGRTLSKQHQYNMHWFWFDGLFASASDNIVINYISIYIIALGASETQIGLMSSFSSIACALILLPGAILAERTQRKLKIAFICGIFARLMILLLIFVPTLFKNPALVWIAIALSVGRDAFNNFGYPAWMDVANGTVPIEGRGRFFGSRNFIMSVTGILTTLLAGKLITGFAGTLGYQIALAVSFMFGMASTFSFGHIHEKGTLLRSEKRSFNFKEIVQMFKGQPQFTALTLTAALWNFGIYISGPFFNVQMVNVLKFSAASIGFVAVITSVTTLITQNQIGAYADRVGMRRLQYLSMWFIPLLPLSWIFATQVWHVALINAFSGIVWGAYNLVSFNLLLATIPQGQVPRYSAVYQIVIMLSMAVGAAFGSALIAHWGFISVLIGSAVVRYAAAILFGKWVK